MLANLRLSPVEQAMLVGESVYFCEVTASVGSTGEPVTYRGSNNADDSKEETDLGPLSRTTTRSLDFVHLDFTASLNSENDIGKGDSQRKRYTRPTISLIVPS
jgi:hypothetical protein